MANHNARKRLLIRHTFERLLCVRGAARKRAGLGAMREVAGSFTSATPSTVAARAAQPTANAYTHAPHNHNQQRMRDAYSLSSGKQVAVKTHEHLNERCVVQEHDVRRAPDALVHAIRFNQKLSLHPHNAAHTASFLHQRRQQRVGHAYNQRSIRPVRQRVLGHLHARAVKWNVAVLRRRDEHNVLEAI